MAKKHPLYALGDLVICTDGAGGTGTHLIVGVETKGIIRFKSGTTLSNNRVRYWILDKYDVYCVPEQYIKGFAHVGV